MGIVIKNTGAGQVDFDAVSLTQKSAAAVPEASTTVSLGFLLALGGVVIAARRKKALATQS